MNPKTAKTISGSESGKELIKFIRITILGIDSCKTTLTNPVEISIEMKAREKAIEKLNAILKPLLDSGVETSEGFDPSPYAV